MATWQCLKTHPSLPPILGKCGTTELSLFVTAVLRQDLMLEPWLT